MVYTNFDGDKNPDVTMSPSKSRIKNASYFKRSKMGLTNGNWSSLSLGIATSNSVHSPSSETDYTYPLSSSDSILSSESFEEESQNEAPNTPDRQRYENEIGEKSCNSSSDTICCNEQSSPSKYRTRDFKFQKSFGWTQCPTSRRSQAFCTLVLVAAMLGINAFLVFHTTKNTWDNEWAYDRDAFVMQNLHVLDRATSRPDQLINENKRESFKASFSRVWIHTPGNEPPHDQIIHRRGALEQYPSALSDVTQLYPEMDSHDERFKVGIKTPQFKLNPYEPEECVPFAEWQTTHAPSCNIFHEMDLILPKQFKLFGTKGYWRHAWIVKNKLVDDTKSSFYDGDESSSESPKFSVLKTLRPEHDYEEEFYFFNQIDAMIMERLTSSPFVMDIYGFCGNSALTEYASTTMNQFRKKSDLSSWKRLLLSRDIARGLEDIHSIDGDFNVTVVHNDLNPSNILMKGSTPKFNDFNIGELLTWNKKHNRPCKFQSRFTNPQWRAPEECPESFKESTFSEEPLTEKIDIYGVGNILFNVLTNSDPWSVEMAEKFKGKVKVTTAVKEYINNEKKKGVKPKFTEDVISVKDPALVAIKDVIEACFERNPDDRPSAHQIVEHFETVIDYLQEFYDTKTGSKLKPNNHMSLKEWIAANNRFQITNP